MNDPRVTQLHEFVDRHAARMIEATAATGKPLSCSIGCSACCSEPAYADYREVLHMLDALTLEQRAYVTEKTAEWLARIEPSGLLDEKLPLALKYRAERAVCPFLRNHLCLVYERRPVGCRLHNAITPREVCEDETKRPQSCFSPEICDAAATASIGLFKGMDMDHIGVWLSAFLLNRFPRSAARRHLPPELAEQVQLVYSKE